VDEPEDLPAAHIRLPEAIRDLIGDDEGPVMVTTWAVVCEYIDETGSAGVAAWASDDPPWRISGLLSTAETMLAVDEYDDEDIEEDD
jgi:hypothetical protein